MAAIAALPNLHSIGLDHTGVTDAGLETLSRSSSLRAIHAGFTQVTDSGIANLASLGNLRTLNLYAGDPEFRGDAPHPSITDVGLAQLKQFPNLEELDVTGSEITGSGLERLALDCPKLRRLVVSHCGLSPDELRHIGLFKQLEQFRCYGTALEDSVVKQFGALTNLRQLAGELQVSNEGIEALSALPNLEEMVISGKCDDSCMASVAAMPCLRDLTVAHTRITNAGFALLADNTKLEHVQIIGNRITTRCIDTLATMPNLRRLGLMAVKPRNGGEPAWKNLESLTPSLSELWLMGCPSLEESDFAKLAQFRDLKTLRIEGGRAITDEHVKHLKSLNKLDYLQLTSTVITDEGVIEIMALPALRRLRINCLATEEGLEALARAPSIRYVTIGSPNLTDEIVQRVHDRHPQVTTMRRTESSPPSLPLSRAKNNTDRFWRIGTEKERVKLNALEGAMAPKLTVTDWLNSDHPLDLAELQGRVVMIKFWGTWCGPCRRQMPNVRGLHEKYAERGLVIVGLHSTKAAERASEYIEANDLSWAIGLDDKGQTATEYAVPHWPSFYLVDRNGVLRIANPSMDDLEAAVVALLNE
ncbi:redoxin domain-containing protein [Novipirellula caenicola]